MSERPASVDYQPYPTTQAGGGGGTPMGVHATPEDFGSQVAGAVQNAGNKGFELAQQYQGFINETRMNQAEVGFNKASSDLEAKYMQYEGLAADAARPQYEAELAALHQQYRQGLPPTVQRAFDSTTMHQMSYQSGKYAIYSAGQIKESNLKSHDAIADQSISAAGDLGKVLDDKQFAFQRDSIISSGNAIADIHGDSQIATGHDEKGNYSYPDTPEGQAATARHMQYTNTKLAQLYLTGAKTIADNQGAAAAANWAQQHWDEMPDKAKVEMNQFLAPKMKNEAIAGNVNAQNAKLDEGWNSQFTKNVPSSPFETPAPQKTALDVINENEGKGYSKDNKGEVVNGINSLAFPKEFAEAKNILDTHGQAEADKYTDNFYQKNIIEKYGISALPAASQAIVADSIVNQGGFGKNVLAAAKAGASPQELIDMRRAEYQRLNNTGLPQYTSAFKGWNNRLDKLQQGISGGEQNAQQGQVYANKAEYIEAHRDDYVQGARNSYLDTHPDDYYGAQIQENRATSEYNKQLSLEKGKLKSDTDTIEKAINGSMTKGVSPTTRADLEAIPGVKDILDRVQREQGDFYQTIDTRLAKASHGALSQTSPNAYDAALATLDTSGSYSREQKLEHLSKRFGSDNSAFSISQKDLNDLKPSIDLDNNAQNLLHNHMVEIATANGNVDGRGQDRAISWYNQVMTAHKQNEALGEKKDKQFWMHIADDIHPPAPGIIEQLKNLFGGDKQQPKVPTLTDKAQFDTLPSGSLYIRDGQQYRKP